MNNKRLQKILNWTEGYARTDIRYLLDGAFWMTAGQTISVISSLLLTIVLTSILSVSEYGIYQFVIAVFAILTATALPGMTKAITRSVSLEKEGGVVSGIKTSIFYGVLGAGAALVLGLYYYYNNNVQLTTAFLLLAALVPFSETLSAYRSVLVGRMQIRTSAMYGAFTRLTSIGVVLGSLSFTHDPVIILFIYVLAVTCMRGILLLVTLVKKPLNKKTDQTMLGYAKHLSLLHIFNVIVVNIDKVIIFHFLGAGQVAIYALATLIPDTIKSSIKNIAVIAIPKFSQSSYQELQNTLLPKISKLLVLMVIAAVAYIVCVPYLFGVVFPQYEQSIFYSQIVIIGTVFSALTPFISGTFEAKKLAKKLYVYNIFSALIQLIGMILLIPVLGILGAIAVRVVARVLEFILSVYLFVRRY